MGDFIESQGIYIRQQNKTVTQTLHCLCDSFSHDTLSLLLLQDNCMMFFLHFSCKSQIHGFLT